MCNGETAVIIFSKDLKIFESFKGLVKKLTAQRNTCISLSITQVVSLKALLDSQYSEFVYGVGWRKILKCFLDLLGTAYQ